MSTKLETLASELETLRSGFSTWSRLDSPPMSSSPAWSPSSPNGTPRRLTTIVSLSAAQKIGRFAAHHFTNTTVRRPHRGHHQPRQQGPFAGWTAYARAIDPKELRGRAMDVVEQSEAHGRRCQTHVVRMLEGKREGARHSLSKKTADAVARHILRPALRTTTRASSATSKTLRVLRTSRTEPHVCQRWLPGPVHTGPDHYLDQRGLSEPVPPDLQREDHRYQRLERCYFSWCQRGLARRRHGRFRPLPNLRQPEDHPAEGFCVALRQL